MVSFNIFKIGKGGANQIDIVEEYNIWNLLRHRYISIESYQFLRNFAHDRDLYLLISSIMKNFTDQAKALEDICKTYKIKAPSRPPKDIKIASRLEEITDKMIFRGVYSDILAELYALDRAYRTSTSNDSVRNQIIDFFYEHMAGFENLYKYGKVKGWTDISPSYKTEKPMEHEQLSTAEAVHIWDHLNTRYDQIRLSAFFQQFVHDMDLQMIIKQGLSTLNKQASMLENLAMKYIVPLPERPPAVQEIAVDTEVMEDEFVFRIIFTGIQSALELHTRAVIESVRNDNMRKVFFDLLKDEIIIFDRLIKYGKMKGWMRVVPMYANKA